MTKKVEIFCCSAGEDESYLRKLLTHLEPKRESLHILSNKDIPAGGQRERFINQYLTRAQIILLLVTPNFIASPSCEKATQHALVRYNNEGTHVIPILVCPVDWENTSFGGLQPLPRNERPVIRCDNEDEAWVNIVKEIGEVVKELPSQAQQPGPLQQPSSSSFSPPAAPQPQMAPAQQTTPAVPPPVPPPNNHQPLPLIVPLRKRKPKLLIPLCVVGALLIIILITILSFPFLADMLHSQQPTANHPAGCVGSWIKPDSIGVYTDNGETLGISDGSYALDTNGNLQDSDDKRQASQELQAGCIARAEALWSAASALDTNDAEPLIYLENQRVIASGRPYLTFVVGVLLGTNRFDAFSRDYLQAAYIAQMEHNRQSRSSGSMLVRLLIAKSGSDPDQSTNIAQQVVRAAQADSTIVGVMGWPTTETSRNTIPIFAHAHIPMVTPGAVSDRLTNFSPYFFRVGSPNKVIGPLLAQYVESTLKAQRIVVFQDSGELYSQSLAKAFTDQYSKDGYESRIISEPFTTGAKDLGQSVQVVLKKDNPDVVVFTSRDVGDMITVLSTVDTDASPQVKVVMGTAAYAVIEGYGVITPDKPYAGYKRLLFATGAYPDEWDHFNKLIADKVLADKVLADKLAEDKKEELLFFQDYAGTFDPDSKHRGTYSYSRPNALVMLGYDAMQVLFYGSKLALQQSKNHKLSPDDVSQALAQIHDAQALQGITGRISFNSNGDPDNKVNFVLSVNQDRYLQIVKWQGCFFINCQPV